MVLNIEYLIFKNFKEFIDQKKEEFIEKGGQGNRL